MVILPIASMFQYASSKGLEVFWDNISSPEALFSLRFTVVLALATTLINGVMGTLVAFMLVRHDFPFPVAHPLAGRDRGILFRALPT